MLDDNPQTQPAVEITIGAGQQKMTRWVFADQPSEMSAVGLVARRIADAQEFERLLSPAPASQPSSSGTIKVEVGEKKFEFPLEQCRDKVVAVGETGFSIKLLRYLPHAVVVSDRQIQSASDQPVNPAIEVEVTGPNGPVKRWAFARFPDFSSMHGAKATEDVKLIFAASVDNTPKGPMEVLVGPSSELAVRFTGKDGKVTVSKSGPGKPIETPFEGMRFEFGRLVQHARINQVIEPLQTAREESMPALQLVVTCPDRQPTASGFASSTPTKLSSAARSTPCTMGRRNCPWASVFGWTNSASTGSRARNARGPSRAR